VRQPWEYVDEILNILKTAFPLLALTMENTAEQIGQRFKPGTDEDMYRLIGALLNDALQQYVARASIPNDPGQLPQMSMANVMRFAESLPIGPLKNDFEEDFVKSKPSLREYVHRLQRWRDNYEVRLDVRPTLQHLEHCSHYLVEFQHQRFDDVELPGQYLRLEDNNSDFVKIARFSPTFELTRSNGMCTRRLSILSNKGSVHSFAVQLPSARYCRREERIIQLLRLLNRVLERRKETRKRGLVFTTPAAVPLSPQLRLVESDASFVSLQDVYERHCEAIGFGKEDPIIAWVEKMRSVADASRDLVNLSNLRMDLLDEISTKMVPDTVLTRYMTRSMDSPSDLWLMRKQFTLQMASTMFLTYAFFISARRPGPHPHAPLERHRGHVRRRAHLLADAAAVQVQRPDAVPPHAEPAALYRAHGHRGRRDGVADGHRPLPLGARARPRGVPVDLCARRAQLLAGLVAAAPAGRRARGAARHHLPEHPRDGQARAAAVVRARGEQGEKRQKEPRRQRRCANASFSAAAALDRARVADGARPHQLRHQQRQAGAAGADVAPLDVKRAIAPCTCTRLKCISLRLHDGLLRGDGWTVDRAGPWAIQAPRRRRAACAKTLLMRARQPLGRWASRSSLVSNGYAVGNEPELRSCQQTASVKAAAG
jgi:hypothetical protein